MAERNPDRPPSSWGTIVNTIGLVFIAGGALVGSTLYFSSTQGDLRELKATVVERTASIERRLDRLEQAAWRGNGSTVR